jgi:hypothetical protein
MFASLHPASPSLGITIAHINDAIHRYFWNLMFMHHVTSMDYVGGAFL